MKTRPSLPFVVAVTLAMAMALTINWAAVVPVAGFQQVQSVVGELAWKAVPRVNCRLTTTATTSTAITGCTAPGAGLSVYVTDVSVYGGVATGATASASVQYGTGGSCGSGTTIVYDCQHAATGGCEAHMTTPIRVAANSEVCLVDATVGTKFVSVNGYIAP